MVIELLCFATAVVAVMWTLVIFRFSMASFGFCFLLRLYRRIELIVLFGFYYDLEIDDPTEAVKDAETIATIFISPHSYGAYDRALIQYVVRKCVCVALIGFNEYGRIVEDAIPVVRKPSNPTINDQYFKAIAEVLVKNGSVWFAPEGTITRSPHLGKLHSGFARVAAMVGKPIRIVPCWWHFENVFKFRSRVFVEFDAPLIFDSGSSSWDCFHGINHLRNACGERLRRLASLGNHKLTLPVDNHYERWVELRALETWCNLGSLPMRDKLQRIKLFGKLGVPVPRWFVVMIKEFVEKHTHDDTTLWFVPSTVGLPTDFKGAFGWVRSWSWYCRYYRGIMHLHHGCDVHSATTKCEATCPRCGQSVPFLGDISLLESAQVEILHTHYGKFSSLAILEKFLHSSPNDYIMAIVPSDDGTLHVLYRGSLNDAKEALQALESEENLIVPGLHEQGSEQFIFAHDKPSKLLEVEMEYCSKSNFKMRDGEIIAATIALRACEPLVEIHNVGDLLDFGGGDGNKTFAVASFLGWKQNLIRVWEIESGAVVTHPVVAISYHSEGNPFVSPESTQESNSVSIFMAMQSLHHISGEESLKRILSRAQWCMIDGGLFILKEHDCDPTLQPALAKNLIKMHERKDAQTQLMSPPLLLRSRQQWSDLLGSYGFERLLPHEESLSQQESNPDNTLLDPKASPHASFVDVFRYSSGAIFPSDAKKSVVFDPIAMRPLWKDPRNNAWRPPSISDSTKFQFYMAQGKWDGLVKNWFTDDGSVEYICGDHASSSNIVICSINYFPRSYVGRMVESRFCIERSALRQEVLSIAESACAQFPLFYVPLFVHVVDDVSMKFGTELIGFPLISKTTKDIFCCKDIHQLQMIQKPYIIQKCETAHVVFKVEVVGDHFTTCTRKTVDLCDKFCGGAYPLPRSSSLVPDVNFKSRFRHLQPTQDQLGHFSTALRKVLGLHLFNYDLLPVGDRFAIVDINHFPGYKDVPNVALQFKSFLKSTQLWNIPPSIVILGPLGVHAVGVELAQRLQCAIHCITANFPYEVNERVSWPPGITTIQTFVRTQFYSIRNSCVLRLSYNDKMSVMDVLHNAIESGFLFHARKQKFMQSLPKSISRIVDEFLRAELTFERFLFLMQRELEIDLASSCGIRFGDPIVCAGELWFQLLHGTWDKSFYFSYSCDESHAIDTSHSEVSAEVLTQEPTWNARRTLKKCGSGGENENAFLVIETGDCYNRYILPRLEEEAIPFFLADLFTIPTTRKPHAHVRLSTCGVRLFTCVDAGDGSGWLLSPNPKYCNPLRSYSLDEVRRLPFVAYWVSEHWYNDEFKRALCDVACCQLEEYDIEHQGSVSSMMKPTQYKYLHTIRDVHDIDVLKRLHNGATDFFRGLGMSVEDMLVDAHYLPQLRYSTLHVHYRSPKEFTRFEKLSRYKIVDMFTETTPRDKWSYHYFGKFNSFHCVWQLIVEHVVPVEILEFGPTLATWGPIFIIGGKRSASIDDLLRCSRIDDGHFPDEMLCEDSLPTDMTNAVLSANVGMRALGSAPELSEHFFVYETPLAYRSIRTAYQIEPIPKFLLRLIEGVNCEQEFRVSTEGNILYSWFANNDGSGWFICPNIKYHPPTVALCLDQLRDNLNFVAWWIAPSWWGKFSAHAVAVKPIALISDFEATSNVAPSAMKKPENYMNTIRDCTSADILVSLLAGASSFFGGLGVDVDKDMEVIDSHYPPALKYGTLHVHFRTKRSFSSNQFCMRYPIKSVISALTKSPSALHDGSVRFFYPHHSGRAVWDAIENNFVEAKKVCFGTRSPTALPFHLQVGSDDDVI